MSVNARRCPMAKVYLVAATLSAAILSAAGAVQAHGRGGFGGPGLPGPRGGPAGGLVERLIYPCPAACLDAGRACQDSADAAAVLCAENVCAEAIATARTACAADATTGGCRTARRALRGCAATCV